MHTTTMVRYFTLILFILSSLLFVQCKQEPLSINPEITHLSDYESGDGEISLNIMGGKQPIAVSWSNHSKDTSLSNLMAGAYIVTILDSKGNTLTDTFIVNQPPWPLCVDVDGNSYKTSIVGDAVWMVENLRTTKNIAGDPLETYVYDNNEELVQTYGRLYNWATAMNNNPEERSAGVCPDGWHIPSDEEWDLYIDNISNMDNEIPNIKTQLGLSYPGFYNGSYQNFDVSVSFWTSTKAHNNAYKRYFHKNLSTAYRYHEKVENAISVRCVKTKE